MYRIWVTSCSAEKSARAVPDQLLKQTIRDGVSLLASTGDYFHADLFPYVDQMMLAAGCAWPYKRPDHDLPQWCDWLKHLPQFHWLVDYVYAASVQYRCRFDERHPHQTFINAWSCAMSVNTGSAPKLLSSEAPLILPDAYYTEGAMPMMMYRRWMVDTRPKNVSWTNVCPPGWWVCELKKNLQSIAENI